MVNKWNNINKTKETLNSDGPSLFKVSFHNVHPISSTPVCGDVYLVQLNTTTCDKEN
jgi:hypothetical protein